MSRIACAFVIAIGAALLGGCSCIENAGAAAVGATEAAGSVAFGTVDFASDVAGGVDAMLCE